MTQPGSTTTSTAVPPISKTNSVVFCFGILACVIFAVVGNWQVMLVMLGGLLCVGVLLLGYRQLLVRMQQRKAAPLLRSILGNTAVSPAQVSEPARRAKLDDLRRSFEGGIEKFRAAGKDLYTLPWYVMVGEPAAGKTEAVRHCNVGFPPGLQDYAQGAGGTINMNWWFTNHAIILDTAGRMIFEEVNPGQSSEWKEFLRLLSLNRPNCPINGLLLVVPADSLIKDEAGLIERKAAKIAQQLDVIQRTLGVRFPVFVVVTKCDLVNGFREFFDTLDNPQLQHQMLGWSNPSPLDAAFNPEQVNAHLETVRRRLVRRRYTLLLDPVHTEDPNLRRIDQVDALFTFPDSFMAIGPRLKRYMELIFTVGEWSPKPLFLRGIYFTSSMREGSALDAELAEILKVPVESLHEGKVWERERAYFLRDLFVKKVFQEKGLVTRASNSKKLQRRRQLAVIGSSVAAIFVLGLMTWWGTRTYQRTLKPHVEFWRTVAQNYQSPSWQLVKASGKTSAAQAEYRGGGEIEASAVPHLKELLIAVPSIVRDKIDPSVFAPIPLLLHWNRPTLDVERGEAYGAVYEACAIRPALTEARSRMLSMKEDQWNAAAANALIEVVRVEADGAKAGAQQATAFRVDPLVKFAVDKDGLDDYTKDRQKLADAGAEPIEWIYGSRDPRRSWPPSTLVNSKTRDEARAAARNFDAAWQSKMRGASGPLLGIVKLKTALQAFVAEQDKALKLAQKPVLVTADYNTALNDWRTQATSMETAKKGVSDALAEVQRSSGVKSLTKLSELYRQKVKDLSNEAADEYRRLAEAAAPLNWSDLPKAPTGEVSQAELAELAALDVLLEEGDGFGNVKQSRYLVFAALYQDALTQMQQAPTQKAIEPLVPPGIAAAVEGATASARANAAEIVKKLEANANGPAVTTWRIGTENAAKYRRWQLIDAALPKQADTLSGEGLRDRIAAAAKPMNFNATIPFTDFAPRFEFSAGFNPETAQALLEGWAAAIVALSSEQGSLVLNANDLTPRRDRAQQAAAAYLPLYIKYWSQDVPAKLSVAPEGNESWESYFSNPLNPATVNRAIEELFGGTTDALQAVADAARKLGTGRASTADLTTAMGNMQDNLLAAKDEKLRQQCEQLLLAWNTTAGRDARKAREALLALSQPEFAQRFLVSGNRGVQSYWSSYSQRRVGALAAEWTKHLEKKFGGIQSSAGFPLVKREGGVRTLSEQEFDALASTIQNFEEIPANDKGATDLARLRQSYKKDWMDNVRKIIAVISKTREANVALVSDPRRSELLHGNKPPELGNVWSDIFVKVGGKEKGQRINEAPVSGSNEPFASIPVRSADAVVIDFKLKPTLPAVEPRQLARPWPAFELLFRADSAQPSPANRQRWEIELVIRQGGDPRSVWLNVDFGGELPTKDAWPTLTRK